MHVQIADGDRDAASQLVRNFKTGLLRIWSAQRSAFIVSEAGIDDSADRRRDRNLSRGGENTGGELRGARRRDRRAARTACGGRGGDGAAHGRLNELPPYWRHTGENNIGVRQIACAAQLNDGDLL